MSTRKDIYSSEFRKRYEDYYEEEKKSSSSSSGRYDPIEMENTDPVVHEAVPRPYASPDNCAASSSSTVHTADVNYYNNLDSVKERVTQPIAPRRSNTATPSASDDAGARQPPKNRVLELEDPSSEALSLSFRVRSLEEARDRWEGERSSLRASLEQLQSLLKKEKEMRSEVQREVLKLKKENAQLREVAEDILRSGSSRRNRVLQSPEREEVEVPPCQAALTLEAPAVDDQWKGPMHQYPLRTLPREPLPLAKPVESYSEMTLAERAQCVRETEAVVVKVMREMDQMCAEKGLVGKDEAVIAGLCADMGVTYVDRAFPPLTSSLNLPSCRVHLLGEEGKSYIVGWYPPELYLPKDRPTVQLVSSAGINPSTPQGSRFIHNRGVVAALAILAEAAGGILSIIAATTGEDESNGISFVWVNESGLWEKVCLDLYMPYVKLVGSGTYFREAAKGDDARDYKLVPFGCGNSLTYDMWPALCEKALAKVHSGYEALAQLTCIEAVKSFTGGPVEHWRWWKHSPEVAVEELERVISTSERGSGIPVLTTHSAVTVHLKTTSGPADSFSSTSESDEEADAVGQYDLRRNTTGRLRALELCAKLQLTPSTSYRVLAVHVEEGVPRVLIRNWQKTALDEEKEEQILRGHAEMPVKKKVLRSPSREESDPLLSADCLWISVEDCLFVFDALHVCFDCRRFTDVRLPIPFYGLSEGICVPGNFIKIHVLHEMASSGQNSVSLWIGLHQPSHSATENFPFGLKLLLIGAERENGFGQPVVQPSYFVLSQSYDGEPQYSPDIWMYVELNINEESGQDQFSDFYILPQMELDRVVDTDYLSVSSKETNTKPGDSTSATLSLLVDNPSLFEVEWCVSPPEMKAAVLHQTLSWIDFEECERVPCPEAQTTKRAVKTTTRSTTSAAAQQHNKAQVNGKWTNGFSWHHTIE
ncbi:gem associated protein 7 [Angomonas deanei]|uniref:Calpain family cysteine protease, putative n=1 Tax=Angomonas deanei TaxID=59799 RepID=A0A7G2C4N1_9TRYP|nr:gem associated protein 7 [Angomonas deanei]CAD2214161.1 Calpain family cysteine protease, putative [Angomonas deanei]|eukprot:EPY19782.1 gem associated protein 7 [Angomonas deanei]